MELGSSLTKVAEYGKGSPSKGPCHKVSLLCGEKISILSLSNTFNMLDFFFLRSKVTKILERKLIRRSYIAFVVSNMLMN